MPDLDFDIELDQPKRQLLRPTIRPALRGIAQTVAPFLSPLIGATKEEAEAAETTAKVINVPQQALFRFAERPELGVRSAIQESLKYLRGERPRLLGRELLRTRGIDLDKTPSLAGEFLAAGLDVLADPILLTFAGVRGLKKVVGVKETDRLLRAYFTRNVMKRPEMIRVFREYTKPRALIRPGERVTLSLEQSYQQFKNTLKKSGILDALQKKIGGRVIRETLIPTAAPGETFLFAGVPIPRIPKSIITQFNLSSAQVARLQAGNFAGFAPAIVRAVRGLPTKALGLSLKEAQKMVDQKGGYIYKRDGKYEWHQEQIEGVKIGEAIVEADTGKIVSMDTVGDLKPTKAPLLKPKEIISQLPKDKVKPLIRQKTGQYVKVEPTIKEPQALRHLLKRQEQAARTSARFTKQQMKETRQLLRVIKRGPIQAMAFEERQQIEVLAQQAKKARRLDELRTLASQISEIKEAGKKKYIQTKEIQAKQFDIDRDLLMRTIGAIEKPVRPRVEAERVREALLFPKIARAITLRPARVFDMFDGGQNFEGVHSQYYFIRENKAVNTELRGIDTRTSGMLAKMKAIGLTESDLIQTRTVDEVRFTVDEMISIYTGAKNVEKTLAIVYGNKIPYRLMRSVIQQMTPQEKALGEAIIGDYETNYGRLRKAFIEYTDGKQDLGKVEGGYTPIRRTMNGYIPTDEELAKELLTRTNLRKAYAERGFTKERLKVPTEFQQPIRLGELSLWTEQMAKQEHFISHGSLIKELQRMVNDPKWSESIRSKFGDPYLEVTRNWVNRVANPNIYKAFSQGDKTIAALRQNAAIAYLGFNLTTMLKQAPSLGLFLSDVSVGELIGGIYDLTTDYRKNMALIHKLSPQMKHRSIERELEEFKNRDPNRYRQLVKRFGNKAMIGIYEIDKLVTHSGWLAVYNKYIRKGLSDMEAADRATRSVLRTQPAAHAKDIAEIYASGAWWSAFLQFTNQLSQIYNIVIYDIPMRARTGLYRDAVRTGFGVALSAYLISWITMGRPPRTQEELKEAGIEQGLSYIPLVGRGAASIRRGFDFTSIPALAGFKSLAEVVRYLEKGEPAKALPRAAEAAAVLAGVPFAQPRRLFRAIREREPARILRGRPRKKVKDEFDLDIELDMDIEGIDIEL